MEWKRRSDELLAEVLHALETSLVEWKPVVVVVDAMLHPALETSLVEWKLLSQPVGRQQGHPWKLP